MSDVGNDERVSSTGPKMADVAREAGVAMSTVSRALAYPDRINKKTRQKVIDAAARLGFSPNLTARTLRVGSSQTVMIVLPPLTLPMSISQTMRGIDDVFVAAGYRVIVGNLDREENTERHLLDLAFGGTVDGVVILSSPLPTAGGRSLMDAGIPIVSVLNDLSAAGVYSVITNERMMMRTLVTQVLNQGHASLCYITGPTTSYHNIERLHGVREAMAGLPPGSLKIIPGRFDLESGRLAAEKYLAMRKRPTAVISANDDMAIAFMKTLQLRGVRIPDDLIVTGFNGVAYGEFVTPSLTTIAQPFQRMGAQAARSLLQALQGNPLPPAREVVDSTIVLRESSGDLRMA